MPRVRASRRPRRRAYRRRRNGEIDLNTLLLVGGGATAAYLLLSKKPGIPAAPEVMIPTTGVTPVFAPPPAPGVRLVTIREEIKLGGTLAAVRTRLAGAGIPYQYLDTGTGWKIQVPSERATEAAMIISAARKEYREPGVAGLNGRGLGQAPLSGLGQALDPTSRQAVSLSLSEFAGNLKDASDHIARLSGAFDQFSGKIGQLTSTAMTAAGAVIAKFPIIPSFLRPIATSSIAAYYIGKLDTEAKLTENSKDLYGRIFDMVLNLRASMLAMLGVRLRDLVNEGVMTADERAGALRQSGVAEGADSAWTVMLFLGRKEGIAAADTAWNNFTAFTSAATAFTDRLLAFAKNRGWTGGVADYMLDPAKMGPQMYGLAEKYRARMLRDAKVSKEIALAKSAEEADRRYREAGFWTRISYSIWGVLPYMVPIIGLFGGLNGIVNLSLPRLSALPNNVFAGIQLVDAAIVTIAEWQVVFAARYHQERVVEGKTHEAAQAAAMKDASEKAIEKGARAFQSAQDNIDRQKGALPPPPDPAGCGEGYIDVFGKCIPIWPLYVGGAVIVGAVALPYLRAVGIV